MDIVKNKLHCCSIGEVFAEANRNRTDLTAKVCNKLEQEREEKFCWFISDTT